MKHKLTGLAVFSVVIFTAWYGGLDFSERGHWQAAALLIALVFGFSGYSLHKDSDSYRENHDKRPMI